MTTGAGGSSPATFVAGASDAGLQRHVAGNDDHGYAALADRLADRDLEDARHLIGAGNEFAIVAALPEQRLWMRLLKVAGADLRRRDLRRDSENGHARTVAVEEAIDEVQVARPATAGAHGEFARQMRLRARRKSADLLMPDMDPLDLPLPADRVGQAIEAIADNSIDSLDARGGERLCELVGYRLCHEPTPGCATCCATCRAPQVRAGYRNHTAIAQRRSLTIARLFAKSHGSRLVGRTQKRHDQGQAPER